MKFPDLISKATEFAQGDTAKGLTSLASGLVKSSKKGAAVAQSGSSSYSPELESMIQMAIEDGELSDREIELLSRRAVKEGIDPEEFEFNLRMRIKIADKKREELKNQNPVVGLSQAFNMMEQYAKGGKQVVSADALTGVMTLIPGVGPLAAAGGLLAAFIETPSNLNQLKAEAIRRFVLPDNPEHLAQFINYAGSQQTEAQLAKEGNFNLKGIVSGFLMGTDIDLIPIWEKKIEEACDKAELIAPSNPQLMSAVRKNKPTLLRKLQAGRVAPHAVKGRTIGLNDVTAPANNDELMEVVEFAFAKKSTDDWEDWKAFHARMYKEAENRFAGNPQLLSRLSNYKVKKFGLF